MNILQMSFKSQNHKSDMAHTFNPSTQEAETGGSQFKANLVYIMSFRQPELHSETMSQKEKK